MNKPLDVGRTNEVVRVSVDRERRARLYKMISTRSLIVTLMLLGLTHVSCSHVQVLRLSSETFAARPVSEVAVLSHEPSMLHTKIAELSETDTSGVQTLQRHILKKAAELGADAVVFFPSVTHTEHHVDYQPAYSPWGYYAPYYGPGPYGYWGPWGYRYGPWGPGWGYGNYVAVPYSVRVTTLKGIAIKYQ